MNEKTDIFDHEKLLGVVQDLQWMHLRLDLVNNGLLATLCWQ